MATKDEAIVPSGYSSGVKKVLVLGGDGETRVTTSNPLPTDATLSGTVDVETIAVPGDCYIGKPSGGDFVTVYTSATTITCSGLPSDHTTLIDEDIVSIVQISSSGSIVETYVRKEAAMNVAANVITVTGASFSSGDTFVIYTNVASASGGGGGGDVNLTQIVGTATSVNAGNVDAGTQRVAIATDDVNLAAINTSTSASATDLAAIEVLNTDIKTATESSATDLAAIEVLNTTIAGDTTSLDAKQAGLGTATMVASNPVTIATDDTLTTATNALLTTIDADTSAIKTATETATDSETTIGTTDVKRVAIFDASNNQITSFGASESYDSAMASNGTPVGAKAMDSVPTAVDSGDMVALLADLYGKLLIAGYNYSEGNLNVNVNNPALLNTIEFIDSPLLDSATGTGASAPVDVSGVNKITFNHIVTSINTNVTVNVESCMDSSFTSGEVVTEDTQTITSNGVTSVQLNDIKLKYVRVNWTTETGGTSAVVTSKMIGGN